MNDPEIDRILCRKDEILPSSGFAASVMEAVRREAAAPPPIAFPWKRALPLVVVAALVAVAVLAGGVAIIVQAGRGAISLPTTSAFVTAPGWQAIRSPAGWTSLSLLIAFISVKLSMRLAGGRM